MRKLWPIERRILEIAVEEYPELAPVLRLQIDNTEVADFKNDGSGFFSSLVVTGNNVPFLDGPSPLDAGYGTIQGVHQAMGFLVFLKEGRLSLIDGYCAGLVSTVSIDFSNLAFELLPGSATTS